MRFKKAIGLAVVAGLLAMAFAALPALASAAQLTNAAGSAIAPQTITMSSSNAITVITPQGLLTCELVEIHGVLTVNNGTEVVIDMDEEGTDEASGCELNGNATTVEPTLEAVELNGSAGTAKFSFKVAGLTEKSTSTVSWVGPKATSAHVAGGVTGGVEGDFTGDFTFFDELGAALTLD